MSGNALVCKGGLLSTVESGLRGAKGLLSRLHCRLLFAIQFGLGFSERLLSGLQGLLSVNAFVRERNLLRPVQSRLRAAKGLLSCGLRSGKRLSAGLQCGLLFAVKR